MLMSAGARGQEQQLFWLILIRSNTLSCIAIYRSLKIEGAYLRFCRTKVKTTNPRGTPGQATDLGVSQGSAKFLVSRFDKKLTST